jgi:transposase
MDTSTQTIQVRGREPRRRFRTVEEKRRIVEEALEPSTSVARVARAHGVNANQLFAWRRLYLQGQLEPTNRETPGLLAVRVMQGAREEARRRNAPAVCGTIQIELPKGTVRIVGMADPTSLHTVLEYLAR